MRSRKAGVVKREAAKVVGARRLQASGGAQPLPEGVAQGRIVEETEQGVTIEITCRCGHKTYLQCNYANTPG